MALSEKQQPEDFNENLERLKSLRTHYWAYSDRFKDERELTLTQFVERRMQRPLTEDERRYVEGLELERGEAIVRSSLHTFVSEFPYRKPDEKELNIFQFVERKMRRSLTDDEQRLVEKSYRSLGHIIAYDAAKRIQEKLLRPNQEPERSPGETQ